MQATEETRYHHTLINKTVCQRPHIGKSDPADEIQMLLHRGEEETNEIRLVRTNLSLTVLAPTVRMEPQRGLHQQNAASKVACRRPRIATNDRVQRGDPADNIQILRWIETKVVHLYLMH